MRDPDYKGTAGRAWFVDPSPAYPTILSTWLFEAEKYRTWPRWLIGLIHLRPAPGVAPPRIHRPKATHEFAFAFLNPAVPLEDDIGFTHGGFEARLILEYQLAKLDDREASSLCARFVEMLVKGEASLDGDTDNVKGYVPWALEGMAKRIVREKRKWQ